MNIDTQYPSMGTIEVQGKQRQKHHDTNEQVATEQVTTEQVEIGRD